MRLRSEDLGEVTIDWWVRSINVSMWKWRKASADARDVDHKVGEISIAFVRINIARSDWSSAARFVSGGSAASVWKDPIRWDIKIVRG